MLPIWIIVEVNNKVSEIYDNLGKLKCQKATEVYLWYTVVLQSLDLAALIRMAIQTVEALLHDLLKVTLEGMWVVKHILL